MRVSTERVDNMIYARRALRLREFTDLCDVGGPAESLLSITGVRLGSANQPEVMQTEEGQEVWMRNPDEKLNKKWQKESGADESKGEGLVDLPKYEPEQSVKDPRQNKAGNVSDRKRQLRETTS